MLDPGIDHLNHGSFGATPREVLAAQAAWRDLMERQPVRFMVAELEPALDAAREELANFVGAAADDLAFVPNASSGVSTVLASLRFAPGDELLTTDHAYNAVRNAMEAVARRARARVVIAPVPFPITGRQAVIDAVMDRITPRTRLAVLDHVTSPTALVFPVGELARPLAQRGIETLVDGAHGPGQLELDVPAMGATYYVGNVHKWVCAPKGAGFLWVRGDRQDAIRPLTISHGANSPRADRSRFRLEFDWTGTNDPSAWLSVPAALRFGARLEPGGWQALRSRNHRLCLDARDLLCRALGVTAPAPEEMIGCMASVPLPAEEPAGAVQGVDLYGDAVHDALLAQGFEVMVTPWPQRPAGGTWRRLIRVSAAAYNDLAQYRRLADVVGRSGRLGAAAAAERRRPR